MSDPDATLFVAIMLPIGIAYTVIFVGIAFLAAKGVPMLGAPPPKSFPFPDSDRSAE